MARPLGPQRTTPASDGPRPAGFYTWRDPARVTPQKRAELEAHDRQYAEPPGPKLSTRDQARQRDVPRTCTCDWKYLRRPARWERTTVKPDCNWHTKAA